MSNTIRKVEFPLGKRTITIETGENWPNRPILAVLVIAGETAVLVTAVSLP